MTRLYLLRHGPALSTSEAGVSRDFERPLSERGQREAAAAASRLAATGARPELILHSPLKRAVETATQACRALGGSVAVKAFEPLSNELAAPQLLEELLREGKDLREVLAVGHQPQLGELAQLLSGQLFDLRPAGLVALELRTKEPAAVLWAANPGDPR